MSRIAFSETEKWRFPCIGQNGKIYCMPFNSQYILELCPVKCTMELIEIDVEIKPSDNWWGTVLGNDGCLYGVPFMATRILKYNPRTQLAEFVGPDLSEIDDTVQPMRFIGGVASGENIVLIPYKSHRIFVFNVSNKTWEFIGNKMIAKNGKWAGGVIGEGEVIIGIPAGAQGVLRIFLPGKLVSMFGFSELQIKDGWIGGTLTHDKSLIYCAPYNSKKVLIIDYKKESLKMLKFPEILFEDGKERRLFTGGSVSKNKSLFFFPEDGPGVLHIRTSDDTLGIIDDYHCDASQKFGGCQVAGNGTIFGIPFNSNHVSYINTTNEDNFTSPCVEVLSDMASRKIALLQNDIDGHKRARVLLRENLFSYKKKLNDWKIFKKNEMRFLMVPSVLNLIQKIFIIKV